MKSFRFSLAALLKVRMHERDLAREVVADALRVERELIERREHVAHERIEFVDRLRKQTTSIGDLDVDAAVANRTYASQLAIEIAQMDHQRRVLQTHVAACRVKLVAADQAVKALEKLRDKQLAEFIADQERRQQRDLEEAWSAQQQGELRR